MSISTIAQQLREANLDSFGKQPVSLNLQISENKGGGDSEREISEMRDIVNKIHEELSEGIHLINLKQDMLENTLQAQHDLAVSTEDITPIEKESIERQTAVKIEENAAGLADTIVKAMQLAKVGASILGVVTIAETIAKKVEDAMNGFGGFVESLKRLIPGFSSSSEAESRRNFTVDERGYGDTGEFGGVPSRKTASSLFSEAKKYEGMSENVNQKELNEFIGSHFIQGKDVKDEPWCAAFVNAVLDAQGFVGTKSSSAKSFLNYGVSITPSAAQPGDIVVFERPGGGHVAFFVKLEGDMITVLGGNQSDKVSQETRDINKKDHKLLDIRRPSDNELKNKSSATRTPKITEETTQDSGFMDIITQPSKWLEGLTSAAGSVGNALISPAGAAEEFTPAEKKERRKQIESSTASTTAMREVGTTTTNTTATRESKIEGSGFDEPLEQFGGLEPEFIEAINRVAKKHDVKPTELAALIASESGFDPKAGEIGKAYGLIQWLPKSARRMGIDQKDLSKMTRTEQMKYVDKWFDIVHLPKGADAATMYTSVFLPSFQKKDVLAKKGSIYYRDNEGLDINKDEQITKADLTKRINQKAKEFNIPGRKQEPGMIASAVNRAANLISGTAEASEKEAQEPKEAKTEPSTFEKIFGLGKETFKGIIRSVAGGGPNDPLQKTVDALSGENFDNALNFMGALFSGESLDYEVRPASDGSGSFEAFNKNTGEVVKKFSTEQEAEEFVKKVEGQGSLGSTIFSGMGDVLSELAEKGAGYGKEKIEGIKGELNSEFDSYSTETSNIAADKIFKSSLDTSSISPTLLSTITETPTATLPKSIANTDTSSKTAIIPMNVGGNQEQPQKTSVIVPPAPQPMMGGDPKLRNEESTLMQLLYDGYRFSIPS
jgi:uncharacterized protein (TIGR02594 family)